MEGKGGNDLETLITEEELKKLQGECVSNLDYQFIKNVARLLQKAFKKDLQMKKLFHPEQYKESLSKKIKRNLGLTQADPNNPLEKTREILIGEEIVPESVHGIIDLGYISPSYIRSTFEQKLCILPNDFTSEGESCAFKKLLTALLYGIKKIQTVKENHSMTKKEREFFKALEVVFKSKREDREGIDNPTFFNALVNYISTNQREMKPDPTKVNNTLSQ